MKKALAYARFSPRPNASECDSIEKQLERIRAYCLAHGYTLVAEYADHAESGAKVAGREQFQLAVDHACRDKLTLVFYDLFRFARNTLDAIRISTQIRDAGAELASLIHHIDTSSPSGRMYFTIMSAIGQCQREEIAERTREALIRYQYVHHKRVTRIGCIPFGYRLDPFNDKKIRPCKVEQEIIRDFSVWYREGVPVKRIAGMLNNAGRLRRGRRWVPYQIKELIRRHQIPGPPEVE